MGTLTREPVTVAVIAYNQKAIRTSVRKVKRLANIHCGTILSSKPEGCVIRFIFDFDAKDFISHLENSSEDSRLLRILWFEKLRL